MAPLLQAQGQFRMWEHVSYRYAPVLVLFAKEALSLNNPLHKAILDGRQNAEFFEACIFHFRMEEVGIVGSRHGGLDDQRRSGSEA
jgi:hypothetical protein